MSKFLQENQLEDQFAILLARLVSAGRRDTDRNAIAGNGPCRVEQKPSRRIDRGCLRYANARKRHGRFQVSVPRRSTSQSSKTDFFVPLGGCRKSSRTRASAIGTRVDVSETECSGTSRLSIDLPERTTRLRTRS